MQLPIISSVDPIVSPAPNDGPPQMSKGTYAFVSLGCPKNLVDSEKMLGTLALDGYSLVSEADGADFVIVNTCGFIDSSRAESKAVIREMLDLKKAGKTKGVIVAGCLPQRLGPALLDELPEIDHIVGVFGRDEINRVADHLIGGAREQRELFRPAPMKAMDDRARLRITPQHYAYLKISEGCDRTCTFCSIPKMRGKHITKPIEMVIAEAQELAKDGVRELNIVAQDTTYYGLDLYGKVRLVDLIKELDQVDGIDWIRLMYLYPIHFTDELIGAINDSPKVIPYLDMPLQHINDQVLKRMQRKVNRSQTEELVRKLRDRVDGLVMRTTFVVGFPGETDQDFQDTMDLVDEIGFDTSFTFIYSPRPGTPAANLPDETPMEVKKQRLKILQDRILLNAARYSAAMVDTTQRLLVTGLSKKSSQQLAGRTECNRVVNFDGPHELVGQFVHVHITEAQPNSLRGRLIDTPT